MSEIFNLAKAFEEKSKLQAQDTEQSVKREFERLEASISADLNSSAQTISNAILEQNTRLSGLLRGTVTRALLWIWTCAMLLMCLLGGIIWYQGQMIATRLSDIDGYSHQLEDLKAQTGAGVAIYGNNQQRNGYLVVLPMKAHGVETYTSTAGNTVVRYTAK